MNSESLWQRLSQGVRRLRQRPDWPRYVGADWPERIMATAVTDDFHAKQGRSTGRLILEAGGQQLAVYLKRHYRLPRWRGLLASIWPEHAWSPALQEWQHLEWARAQGVPVPATVAYADYIGPWGRLQSFLAVEELTGMLPLHQALPLAQERLSADLFRLWKRGLIEEVARLVRALHVKRCFHKDLYLCHFYIPGEDTERLPNWRGRVHLIDLHRLQQHRWTWRLWQAKDLGQLLFSSENAGVDVRDRLHFWRAYLEGKGRSWSARWLRQLVLFKWRLYRRHNQKLKARKESEPV